MVRSLSWTPAVILFKYILPPYVCLFAAILAATALWGAEGVLAAVDLRLGLLGMVPFLWAAWMGVRLKRVYGTEDGLIIHGYVRRTHVPYDAIRSIVEYPAGPYVVIRFTDAHAEIQSARLFVWPWYFTRHDRWVNPEVWFVAETARLDRLSWTWFAGRRLDRTSECNG